MPRLTLEQKLDAFGEIAKRARWPEATTLIGRAKIRLGHQEHGHTDRVVPHIEAHYQAADIGGYGGIASLRGLWSWEWWVAVVLAGLIGRVLGRIARRENRQ